MAAKILFDQEARKAYLRPFNKVAFGKEIFEYDSNLETLTIYYYDSTGAHIRKTTSKRGEKGDLEIMSITTLKTETEESIKYDALNRVIAKDVFVYEYVTLDQKTEYILITNKENRNYTKLVKKTSFYKD